MATPFCVAFVVLVSALMAASRGSGSMMSVCNDTHIIVTWLPPSALDPGTRVEIGTIETSGCVGSSPRSERQVCMAPPRMLRQASLTLASGTAFLICLMSSRGQRWALIIRWAPMPWLIRVRSTRVGMLGFRAALVTPWASVDRLPSKVRAPFTGLARARVLERLTRSREEGAGLGSYGGCSSADSPASGERSCISWRS